MSNSTAQESTPQVNLSRIQELENKNNKHITKIELDELASNKKWRPLNGFQVNRTACFSMRKLNVSLETIALYGVINSLMYDKGFFYGSIKWLMWQTGFKHEYLRRRIKELEDVGLIRIEGKDPHRKIFDCVENMNILNTTVDNSPEKGLSTEFLEPGDSTQSPADSTQSPRDSTQRIEAPILYSYKVSPKESIKEEYVIFDFWKETLKHFDTKLTKERITKIQEALKWGLSVDELKNAIVGLSKDAFHTERKYCDIKHVFKDKEKAMSFIALANKSAHRSNLNGSTASKHNINDSDYIKRKTETERLVNEAQKRGMEQFEKMAARMLKKKSCGTTAVEHSTT